MTAALITLLLALGADPAEDLNCLTADERAQATLSAYLLREVHNTHEHRAQLSGEELTDRVRSLLGIAPLSELPEPTGVDLGRVQRETYHIDRLVLKTPTSVLPGLTFHPKEPRAGAYLYLHDSGKLADEAAMTEIEDLVAAGSVVVTIDLRGQGETASECSGRSPDRAGCNPLSADAQLASLLGRPLLGLHVEDTLAAGHFVAHYQTDEPREVHLIGVGQSGLTALHAAALRPDLFTTVTLHNTPRDWSSLIGEAAVGQQLTDIVPGALKLYDLPELVELLGVERVKWE
ncbi:MAG: hypothetical protein JNG89_15335 [Planctomycetaceae bacterium]|nr:hypothetical protein [Planctomycetaceae bacterium]